MQGQSVAFYAAISALAGVLIPILAALSGALGRTLDNPWAASAITITGAFALVVAVTLATGSANVSWDVMKQAKPIQLVAGLGMAFYICSATWLAPRFGVGNFVMFVLAGQLVSSAMIDHFGLFGAPQKPLDLMRIAGIAIMAAGVVIAQMAASSARPVS